MKYYEYIRYPAQKYAIRAEREMIESKTEPRYQVKTKPQKTTRKRKKDRIKKSHS